MNVKVIPTAIVFLSMTLMTGPIFAADGDPEGRPLPDLAKAIIWQKACDLAYKNYDVDCAENKDPALCGFRRSGGEAFQPHQTPDQRTFVYGHFSAGNDVIAPAAEGAGWTSTADKWGDTLVPAFEFLSGLTLTTSTPYELVKITPEALAWIKRELIPEPSQAMCGKTAGEYYDASFKTMVQTSVLAWEHVRASGKLRGLKAATLGKEHDARRGATWTLCEKFAKKVAQEPDSERTFRDECQFWLRRGAAGQAEAVASVLGAVVQRFDPEFFKAHEKAFPAPAVKKTPKPR